MNEHKLPGRRSHFGSFGLPRPVVNPAFPKQSLGFGFRFGFHELREPRWARGPMAGATLHAARGSGEWEARVVLASFVVARAEEAFYVFNVLSSY